MPQQLGFSLVAQSSCKPGFSGTETVFVFKPLVNQVKHLRMESEFFFLVGYWEHLINNYSEIKMLSVLPRYCSFGHDVRAWSRVKGNFSKGFLEVCLGWTCTNCVWTRARSFEVTWPLSCLAKPS